MKALFSITAVLAGLLSVPVIQAGNLAPACPTGDTLAYYQANFNNVDHECSVGILNFTDFTFGTNLDGTNVGVVPVVNGSGGAGFELEALNSSVFTVGAGSSTTYNIDWLFQIDPGPGGASASLDMDPPFGNVTLSQNYCVDGTFGDRCSSGDTQSLTLMYPGCDPGFPAMLTGACSTSSPFNPPIMNFAGVQTVINLNGVGTQAGSGFDALTGTVTVTTPEPGTLLLVAGGLLTIGLRRRRRV